MMLASLTAGLFLANPCAAECESQSPEAFNDFLARFSSEKPFAIERTQLPLAVVKWIDGVDVEGKSVSEPHKFALSLAEYWRWPTLNEYVSEHHLESRISEQSKAAASLELYREGYAQKVSYRFELNGGCWVLKTYEAKPI